MKRTFVIKKGVEFNSNEDNDGTSDAMEFIESFFDERNIGNEDKYLNKDGTFKKSHKIMIEIQ